MLIAQQSSVRMINKYLDSNFDMIKNLFFSFNIFNENQNVSKSVNSFNKDRPWLPKKKKLGKN